MTLHARDPDQLPADIAAVGQRLLPATNPYRVIGDQLADLLRDEQFAALYEPTGRAAVSPAVLALVTLFQFLEDVPDRQAAELVVVRLDWKYALHLSLEDLGFDFSVLCYFRGRLLAHGQERLLFDTLLAKLKALGLVRKRGKQRTDSLAVLGAVRQLSELETVTETLRLVLRAVAQTDPAWRARMVPASVWRQYVETRPDYRLSAAERSAALLQAGADAIWLLSQLDEAPAPLPALGVVQTLRTVWAQRYQRDAQGMVQLRPTPVPCTERIVTPHDPGVRAGEKRGNAWVGEKVHVTETADADGPNFLLDVSTAGASSGDGEALPRIRARLAAHDLLPSEQYVDAGYVSGKQLADSAAAGVELVGPPLADTSPHAFKIGHFQIERATRTAICPAGARAVKWSVRHDRDGSAAVNIQFAAAVCAVCPLRPSCTTSRSGRSLHLSEHYERLEARRAEAQTAAFKDKMRARPAIEATLSELVRAHGLRRHRYRGEQKRPFENLLKGTACNLKRLLWLLSGRPRPRRLPLAGAASIR